MLAPARHDRPQGDDSHACPFCPGQEADTPPELWADRPEGVPNGPGWQVRAIPNAYPAFTAGVKEKGGPHHGEPARGHSEVLVHSPDHRAQLGTAPIESVLRTVRGWRLRHLALSKAEGWVYVQTSVSHGAGSGATQPHPHSQITALPFVPEMVEREAETMDDACLLCRLGQAVDEELLAFRGPTMTSLCPPWSRMPYEMLLLPRLHEPHFEESDGFGLEQTADLLHECLGRLHRVANDPPFTLVLHSGPRGDTARFHWHVHIWPRLAVPESTEWGLGISVLSLDPAQAAAALRSAGEDSERR